MSAVVDLQDVEPSTDYDFEDADRPCGGATVGGLDVCTAARITGIAAIAVVGAFWIGRFVGGRNRPDD